MVLLTIDIFSTDNVSVLIHSNNPGVSTAFDSLEIEDEEWSLVTVDGCHCIWEKLLCQNLHIYNLSIVPWDVEYL